MPSIKELREIPAYKGIPSQIPLNMHSTVEQIEKNQNTVIQTSADKNEIFGRIKIENSVDINVFNFKK